MKQYCQYSVKSDKVRVVLTSVNGDLARLPPPSNQLDDRLEEEEEDEFRYV